MLTIAESEIYSRYVTDYWTEEERGEFAAWIAEHYDTGDVVRDPVVAERLDGHAKAPGNMVGFASFTTTCLKMEQSGCF